MGAQPLTYEQVWDIIKNWNPEEQERLSREISKRRLAELMENIQKDIPENDITEDEIVAICKEVRQQMFEERNRENRR